MSFSIWHAFLYDKYEKGIYYMVFYTTIHKYASQVGKFIIEVQPFIMSRPNFFLKVYNLTVAFIKNINIKFVGWNYKSHEDFKANC